MANDSTELIVASSGSINVAPVGTTLPTAATGALAAAFVNLGYVTEDGVTLTVTPQITDFNAWQSRQPVRRELTNQEVQAAFALEQWNDENLPLAFGGGAVTQPSAGVFRYDLPAPADALDERALVVIWLDGTTEYRLVLPRGNVSEAVAVPLKRSELAVLPITFKALQPDVGQSPGYLLTNDATFPHGS
jgi:hypothetical protein